MDYSVAKIKDKINSYKKSGKIVSSFFLTPIELNELVYVLKDIPFCIIGGYNNAERKIIVIGTEDALIDDFCDLISIASKNKELTHRDVLGSVLGLGIKREMIGDIIIDNKICNMIVMHEMKEYILNNLKTVGREKVDVKEIKFSEMIKVESKGDIKNITIASLRLDAIISAVYGISREKSNKIISLEKVMINYLPCINNSKVVKKDDLISVRGFGRIKILDVIGETRKGRQKVLIEIF